MKQIALFLCIVALCAPISAQQIVSQNDERYIFPPQCCGFPLGTYDASSAGQIELFQQHYTEEPLSIHGMSFALMSPRPYSNESVTESCGTMVIYQQQQDGSHVSLITAGTASISTLEYNEAFKHRQQLIDTHFGISDGVYDSANFTFYLLDFYFPQPVIVTGTFYAGIREFQSRPYRYDYHWGQHMPYCSCWQKPTTYQHFLQLGTEVYYDTLVLWNNFDFHPITHDTIRPRLGNLLIILPPTLDSTDCITPLAPELLYTDAEAGLVSLQLQVN
ncbi:MAG: hypothetical protein HUK17_04780, partial [Bacteroidales bacterium]|nr:hypothetical protein [Bacteroidales bacterium]